MDTLAFLTLLVCACMLAGCDGVPVTGEWRCPFLPCPELPPCARVVHTYYWNNQSGAEVLCQGCDQCVSRLGEHRDSGMGQREEREEERRELDSQDNCEDILCAALPPTCKVTATREPSQLVGHNGQPCPVCPVCLDYIADLPLTG